MLARLSQTVAVEAFQRAQKRWKKLCNDYLPIATGNPTWRYSRTLAAHAPLQGWKIHISSTVITACDILSAIGPELCLSRSPFKAAASLDELMRLNSGISYGYSQIGKIITVYPDNESEFIRIVRVLAPLLAKWPRGPAVPYDLRYKKTCLYYRYGAFSARSESASKEYSFPSILTPEGMEVEDRRDTSPCDIPWLRDPFACEAESEITQKITKLNNRYAVYKALSQRGKGGVYECLDLSYNPPPVRILKEGRKNGESTWDGRDGKSRIRNESQVLKSLSRGGVNVPRVWDKFEADGNVYLVLEHLDGINLSALIAGDLSSIASKVLLRLCRQLSEIVLSIHNEGWLWRDCKPANFIVEMGGTVRAIDFEGACPIIHPDPLPWSTPLFTPPEFSMSDPISLTRSDRQHDLYALGVCLSQLLGGQLPKKHERHGVAKIDRRDIPMRAKNLISQLLSDDPSQRPDAETVSRTFQILVA